MFLLVGGDSEIGAATFRFLTSRGQLVAATTRRREQLVAGGRFFLDLAEPLERWEPPPATRAACIFAGIPRLADCAADPAGSAHINVTGTQALVERLLARDVAVLFLSTNQVFDGSVPNVASDAPFRPVSEYGRQKARMESILLAQLADGAPIAVLRLAKIMSASTALMRTWMGVLSAGSPIRCFNDMRLAPTPTDLVAAAIAALLADRARGIFQLTGPRDVTYAELGRLLAARLGADPALVTENSAQTAGMPEGATPLHTTLDSCLLRDHYGLQGPDVGDVVDMLVAAGEPEIVLDRLPSGRAAPQAAGAKAG